MTRDCSAGVTPYGLCAVNLAVSGTNFALGVTKTVSVTAGTMYTSTFRVRVAGSGRAVASILPADHEIRWLRANGSEVSHQFPVVSTRHDSTYFRYERQVLAPAEGVSAKLTYYVYAPGPDFRSPAGTHVYLDDARLERLDRLPRVNGGYAQLKRRTGHRDRARLGLVHADRRRPDGPEHSCTR